MKDKCAPKSGSKTMPAKPVKLAAGGVAKLRKNFPMTKPALKKSK